MAQCERKTASPTKEDPSSTAGNNSSYEPKNLPVDCNTDNTSLSDQGLKTSSTLDRVNSSDETNEGSSSSKNLPRKRQRSPQRAAAQSVTNNEAQNQRITRRKRHQMEQSSSSQLQVPLQTQNFDESDSSAEEDNDVEEESPKPKRLRKGRRKIAIEFIEDKSRRHITFSKRKTGIMKKAYELATLTGTQVLLLVASETGHVYTFATNKLQPLITQPEGKSLIQACLNAPDVPSSPPSYSSRNNSVNRFDNENSDKSNPNTVFSSNLNNNHNNSNSSSNSNNNNKNGTFNQEFEPQMSVLPPQQITSLSSLSSVHPPLPPHPSHSLSSLLVDEKKEIPIKQESPVTSTPEFNSYIPPPHHSQFPFISQQSLFGISPQYTSNFAPPPVSGVPTIPTRPPPNNVYSGPIPQTLPQQFTFGMTYGKQVPPQSSFPMYPTPTDVPFSTQQPMSSLLGGTTNNQELNPLVNNPMK